MKKYLADRFKTSGGGLSLDTAALSKYNDVIDLSIGDTDIITDDSIIEAAFRDAKAGYTHYGVPKGDPELVAAVCQAWQEDFGQSITSDNVLVTTSSCLGMSLIMMAILNPGDEVLVFSPYFPMYKDQIELAGGKCVEVPTYAEENFAINEERVRAAITPKTRAIIFNNPNNPTGMAYDKAATELIAKLAQEYDLLVAADEIYTTYMYEGEFVPMRSIPGMEDRTLTLNSFSKNFLMTGWRIGVIIAHPLFVSTMNNINGALTYASPSISQRAALQALKVRENIRNEYISVYRERVLYAADRAAKIEYLDLVRPRGTFYLFPSIKRTGMSSPEFTKALLEKAHILVTPGHIFGATGAGHFRIACTVNKDKLKEAFDRMEGLKF